MTITVNRKYFTDKETIGELYINDKFFCYTLEDEIREIKVAKETAIPYGTYPVKITYSNKFGKLMPIIENVPNFEGIRIHVGNTEKDTDGCLLVGFNRTENSITQSTLAYNALYTVINNELKAGNEVEIKFTSEEKKNFNIFLIVSVLLVVSFLILKYKFKIF